MKRIKVLVLGLMAAIVCAASSLAIFVSIKNRAVPREILAAGGELEYVNNGFEDYYLITSATGFSGTAADTETDGNTFGYLSKQELMNFRLGSDITITSSNIGSFILGQGSVLDGGIYNPGGELTGSHIVRMSSGAANNNPLFARLYGTVKNVIFENVKMEGSTIGGAGINMGVVAASIGGSDITNNSARIENVTVKSGSINYAAPNTVVGALVGTVSGDDNLEIVNCRNEIPVTAGNYAVVGGLIGSVSTTGTVTIQDSGNTGAIKGGKNSSAGGLVGWIQHGIVDITNGSNGEGGNVTVGNYSAVGGIIGRNSSDTVELNTTTSTGIISGGVQCYADGLVGCGFYTADTESTGTAPDGDYLSTPKKNLDQTYYEISTADELAFFQGMTPDASIRLMNDIDMSQYQYWTPIAAQKLGTIFDGNGFAIRHLSLLNGNNRGLFSVLRGTVQNISFLDVNILGGDGTINGVLAASAGVDANDKVVIDNVFVETGKIAVGVSSVVGGLVGRHDYGSITIQNSYTNINITADYGSVIGGILGQARNRGGIAAKTVTISTVYSSGDLTVGASSVAGGILGNYYLDTDTRNLKITRTLSAGHIQRPNSTAFIGRVVGMDITGLALIGSAQTSALSNRYNSADSRFGDNTGTANTATNGAIPAADAKAEIINILGPNTDGVTAFKTHYAQITVPVTEGKHFEFTPLTDNTEEEGLLLLHSRGSYNSIYRFTILPELGYHKNPPTVSYQISANTAVELTPERTMVGWGHQEYRYLYTYTINAADITFETKDFITITVNELTADEYTVDDTEGTGTDINSYTVNLNPDAPTPTYGMPFDFTVTAADHYNISKVTYAIKTPINENHSEGNYIYGTPTTLYDVPSKMGTDSGPTPLLTVPGKMILGDIQITVTTVHEIYTITPPTEDNFTFNGADIATHGTPYTFTVTADPNYNITAISYTINDDTDTPITKTESYTPTIGPDIDEQTVIITGAEILDNIEITVTTAHKFHTVNFANIGNSAFADDANPTHGTDYKFTLTPAHGADEHWDITNVTYTINGETTSLAADNINAIKEQSGMGEELTYQYTIPGGKIVNSVTINATTARRKYTVSYSGTDGFNGKADETAANGTNFTINLTDAIDADNYYIESVIINNNTPLYSHTDNGGYTDEGTAYIDQYEFEIAGNNIACKQTVVVNTLPRVYTVTPNTDINDNFEITHNPTAAYGTPYEFTVAADENYHIVSVAVNYGKITEHDQTFAALSTGNVTKSAQYTIAGGGINGNIIITVTTAPDTYKLLFSNYNDGTYRVNHPEEPTVTHSELFGFEIIPEPGYEIYAVEIDGTPTAATAENLATGEKTYQINGADITGDITVTVTMVHRTYNVTVVVDNVTVEDNDYTEMLTVITFNNGGTPTHGTDFVFSSAPKGTGWKNSITITRHTGADTELLSVDEKSSDIYTILGNEIIGNITISVTTTQEPQYTITDGGDTDNFTRAGASAAVQLTDYPFIIRANPHFYIESITYTIGDKQVSVLSNNADRTVTVFDDGNIPGGEIIGDIVITVETQKIPYNIAFPAAENRTISNNAPTAEFDNGDYYTFTVKPSLYYEITGHPIAVRNNGSFVTVTDTTPTAPLNAPHTYAIAGGDITDDITVTVPAATKIIYNVTFDDPANGHYSVQSGAPTATFGDDYTFTVSAAPHYNITEIKYSINGGQAIDLGIQHQHELNANNIDTHTIIIGGGDIKGNITIIVVTEHEFYEVEFEGSEYTAKNAAGSDAPETTAAYGTDYGFTVTANTHYTITDVQYKIGVGNWVSLGADGNLIAGGLITDAVTVKVITVKTPYTVTFQGSNPNTWTVTGDASTATFGDDYMFFVTPAHEYKITKIEYSVVGGQGSITLFTGNGLGTYNAVILGGEVKGNITVTITTAENTLPEPTDVYIVTFAYAGPDGAQATVTDAAASYEEGSTAPYTFTVTPNDHYAVSVASGAITIDKIGAATYRIAAGFITEDIIITITANPIPYAVSSAPAFGGSAADFTVKHNGGALGNAAYNASYEFTADPTNGHKIVAVQYQINGKLYGLEEIGGTYTIPKYAVTGIVQIIVTAADADNNPTDPDVPPSAIYPVSFIGNNYSIVTADATAANGTDYTFTVKANTYYEIITANVTASNGTPSFVGESNGELTYTVTGFTGAFTISVAPTPLSFAVSSAPAESRDSGKFTVQHDNNTALTNAQYTFDYNFTVTANAGYEIAAVKYQIGNGTLYLLELTDGTYTIDGGVIIAAVTIVVATADNDTTDTIGEPEETTFDVSFNAPYTNNYTVNMGAATATKGTDYTFDITPHECYDITGVTYTIGGGTPQSPTGTAPQYTINGAGITGSIVITVTAAPKQYTVTITPPAPNGFTFADVSGIIAGNKVTVTHGTDYKFTVTPAAGNTIVSVEYKIGNAATAPAFLLTAAGGTYTINGGIITDAITIIVTTAENGNPTDDDTTQIYPVSFNPGHSAVTASASAANGTDYIFTVTANTNYTVSAVTYTVNGGTPQSPASIYPVGGGTSQCTIDGADITGSIVITVTTVAIGGPTPTTYVVTPPETDSNFEFEGELNATAGTDYTFTVTPITNDQMFIECFYTNNDDTYYLLAPYDNNEYIIPGAFITGDISISITVLETTDTTHTITFTGDIGNVDIANYNGAAISIISTGAYIFAVTPKPGYEITGIDYAVIGGDSGTWDSMIDDPYIAMASVEGDLTITIETTATPPVGPYNVSFDIAGGEIGTLTGAAYTTNNADYTFTVTAKTHYQISEIIVTIGDNSYITYTSGGIHIIPAADIDGDIEITVTTEIIPNEYTVSFTGENYPHPTGGPATYNTGYTFNLTAADPDYTVVDVLYRIDSGEWHSLGGNGYTQYTIPGGSILGNITVWAVIDTHAEPTTPPSAAQQYNVTFNIDDSNRVGALTGTATYTKGGAGYTFAVTAKTHYQISTIEITIGGVQYHADTNINNGTYTYNIPDGDIDGNIVITVTTAVVPDEYTVSFPGEGEYYNKTSGNARATYNTAYEFTVAPSADYQIVNVLYSVGGGNQYLLGLADGKYTIPGNKVNGNITITVITATTANPDGPIATEPPYTVEFQFGNGNITDGSGVVNAITQQDGTTHNGTTGTGFYTFTVTPRDNYAIRVEYSFDSGVTFSAPVTPWSGNQYRIQLANNNLIIKITAVANEYTVTLTSNNSDAFTHTANIGASMATHNENYEFTVTANGTYAIADVSYKIGGSGEWYSLGNGGTYTINGKYITDAIEIKVITETSPTLNPETPVEIYTVNFEFNDGVLSVAGERTYTEGSTTPYTFTVTAKEHYTIASIAGFAYTDNHDGTYTFTIAEITGDMTITIVATAKSYGITFDDTNCTVTNNNNTAPYDTAYTFTVAANANYDLVAVQYQIDGTDKWVSLTAADGSYTIPVYTITAGVTIRTITVGHTYNAAPPAAGNFTFTGTAAAQYGSSYTFTVTATAGHTINGVSWRLDGDVWIPLTANGSGEYTIDGGDITDDIEITVTTTPISVPAAKNYAVELDGSVNTDIITAVFPTANATEGVNYTFTVEIDANYDKMFRVGAVEYSVDGGNTFIQIIPNADGEYTIWGAAISAITNGITKITIRAATVNKIYTVDTNNGKFSVNAAPTAEYGTPYTFTVTANAHYNIDTVTVTIGDVQYNADTNINNGTYTYTIPDTAITGGITIGITTTPKKYTVTFNLGNKATARMHGSTQYLPADLTDIETPYTFDIRENNRFNITAIIITIGGTEYKKYTYPAVTGVTHDIYEMALPAGAGTGDIVVTVTAVNEVYTLTFIGENFVTVTAPAAMEYGSAFSFELADAPHYRITDVTVESPGQSAPHGGKVRDWLFSYTNAFGNLTITVETEALAYNVTKPTVGNFDFTGGTNIAYDEIYTFTVTAKTHYKIADVRISGSGTLAPNPDNEADGVQAYTVTGFTGNFEIFVTTRPIIYTATAPEEGNFTFAFGSTDDDATYGTPYTFTVTADEHYQIDTVTVNNGSATDNTDGTYTVTGFTGDFTITVTTAPLVYTVTAPAAGNFEITDNAATVAYGAEYTFTVTANMHYQITGVTVNNGSVNNQGAAYTVTGFTGDFAIFVTTTETIYNVNFTNAQNTVTGVSEVKYLHDYSFTVMANAHYNITRITYTINDGASVEVCTAEIAAALAQNGISADTYTITISGADIIGNIEIAVETTEEIYTVSHNGGDGRLVIKHNTFIISDTYNNTVTYKTAYSFTVEVNPGYTVTGISYTINGGRAVPVDQPYPSTTHGKSDEIYTVDIPAEAVIGDIVITVYATAESYDANTTITDAGTATVTYNKSAAHGTDYTFTVDAADYYKISQIVITINGIITPNSYTPTYDATGANVIFTSSLIDGEIILGNIEITVETAPIEYGIELFVRDRANAEIDDTDTSAWVTATKTFITVTNGVLQLSATDTAEYKHLSYRIGGDVFFPANGRALLQITFNADKIAKYADDNNTILITAIFVPKYEMVITNTTPDDGTFAVYAENSPTGAAGSYKYGDVLRIVVTPKPTKQVNVAAIREQLLGLRITDNAVTAPALGGTEYLMISAGKIYDVSFEITRSIDLKVSFIDPIVTSFNLAFATQTNGSPEIIIGKDNSNIQFTLTSYYSTWNQTAFAATQMVNGYRFDKWQISTANGYRDIETLFENDPFNPAGEYARTNYFRFNTNAAGTELTGVRFINELVTHCIVDGTITIVAVYTKGISLTVSMGGEAAVSPVDNNFAIYRYVDDEDEAKKGFRLYSKDLNAFNEKVTLGTRIQIRYNYNSKYFVLNGISGIDSGERNGNIIEFTMNTSRIVTFDISALAISLHMAENTGSAKGAVNYSFADNETVKIGDTILIEFDLTSGYLLNSWTINGLAPTEIVGAEYNANDHSVQIPVTKEFMEWAIENLGMQQAEDGTYALTAAVAITTVENDLLSKTYMGGLIAGPAALIIILLCVFLILRKRAKYAEARQNKANGYKPEPKSADGKTSTAETAVVTAAAETADTAAKSADEPAATPTETMETTETQIPTTTEAQNAEITITAEEIPQPTEFVMPTPPTPPAMPTPPVRPTPPTPPTPPIPPTMPTNPLTGGEEW